MTAPAAGLCPDPASRLATSTSAAGRYLLQRRDDADALVSEGITRQPYVKVRCAPNGGVLVGDVWCASGLCAAAYILSRWW